MAHTMILQNATNFTPPSKYRHNTVLVNITTKSHKGGFLIGMLILCYSSKVRKHQFDI